MKKIIEKLESAKNHLTGEPSEENAAEALILIDDVIREINAPISDKLSINDKNELWDDVRAIVEYTHDVDAIIEELKKCFIISRKS